MDTASRMTPDLATQSAAPPGLPSAEQALAPPPPPAGDASASVENTTSIESNAQPTADAQPTSAPPPAPAPKPTADDMAVAIERSRRRLREESAALDRQRAEMRADLEEGRKARATLEEIRKDPLAALRAGGHDLTAATKAQLDELQRSKPHEMAKAAAEEARKLLDEAKAEREATKLEATIARRVHEIASKAETDPRFELTKAWRWGDGDGGYISGAAMAEAVMRAHFAKTGTEMPVVEALERIERYIEEQEVPRLLPVRKLAAKFAEATAKKTPSDTPGVAQERGDHRFTPAAARANGAPPGESLDAIAALVANGRLA